MEKGTRKEFPCPKGTSLTIDKNGKGHHEKIENAIAVSEIKKGDWNSLPESSQKGITSNSSSTGNYLQEFTDKLEGQQLKEGFIGLQLHDKGNDRRV